MSGVSVHGDLERTLCKVIKLKPGLPWIHQGAGDARVMGYLQKVSSGTSGREKSVLQSTRLNELKM